MAFASRKRQIIRDIAAVTVPDKSPKGGLDAPIVPLVYAINAHVDYVTTSSCSGRIVLYAGGAAAATPADRSAGRWLMAQHATVTVDEVERALETMGATEDVHFKAEPFVMHVECRDIEAAQALLHVAIRCGFRESGISAGRRKCMVGIRTTANTLELPVAVSGTRVADRAYLSIVVEGANRRFRSNAARTTVFQRELEATLLRRDGGRGGGRAELSELAARPPRWEACGVDCGELLERWGHSATSVGAGRVLVFGGFGGGGQQRRVNDVVLVRADPRSPEQLAARRVALDPAAAPSPRCFHSASRVALGAARNPAVLIYGGRGGPSAAMSDVHLLEGGLR